MSVFHNNALIGSGAGTGAAAAVEGPIKSLRFNNDDSAYLNRTTSSSGNRRTWTWSCWLKRSGITDRQEIFAAGSDGTDFFFESDDKLQFYYYTGAYQGWCKTDSVFRDTSAWYHIVLVFNSTESTASDRVKIYVNNVLQPLTFNQNFSQNVEADINNNNTAHYIGRWSGGSQEYADYCLASVHFVDGSALDPTSFGAYDGNGVWQAADYSGTFGTNGFHLLDFANEATIGHDSSGNNNDFTANNLEVNGTTQPFIYWTRFTSTGSGAYQNSIGSRSTGGSYSGNVWTATNSAWVDTWDFGANPNIKSFVLSNWSVSSYDDQAWYFSNDSSFASSVSGPNSGTIASGTHSLEVSGTRYRYLRVQNVPGATYSLHGVADGVGDITFDVPTNGTQSDTGAGGEVSGNYATLNPLVPRANTTYSNGNLQLASGGNYRSGVATIGITGGKFYFEGEILTDPDNGFSMIGITTLPNYFNYPGSNGDDDGFGWYSGTGQLYFNDALGATYSSWTVGDIVSVAYDSATRRTWIAKNGTWQNSGNPAAGSGYVHTSSGTLPVFFSIATGTNGVVAANFGQRAFAYSAPSGFKALCTTNLPTPTIADGSDNFETLTWDGDGSGSRSFTGLVFQPDFTWVKIRTQSYTHTLFDAVRGAGSGKELQSNSTNAEGGASTNAYGYLSAFNSDGFSSTAGSSDNDYFNKTGNTYVAWNWNAGANSSKTYTVTVVSDSGNKYRFDGHGTSAVTLDLAEGSTYVFDQSDSSNSGHPLRFSTTSDGTHGSGSEYTTGVTATGTPGSAGAKTTIVLGTGVATLYYYCTNHSGMGGQINTNSTAGSTRLSGSENASAYNQSATWSNLVTGTLDTQYGNSSATAPFDGDTGSSYSDGIRPTSGNYLSMNFGTTFANATSVKIYGHASLDGVTYAGSNENLKINGTAIGNSDWADNGGSAGQSSATFTLSSGLTTLEWGYSSGSQSTGYLYLQGIEVDGRLLVDSNQTPPAVPTINSVVKANPSAGFSIVTYTGTGSTATIGHGLNAAPGLIIVKSRTAADGWPVYHQSLSNTANNYLTLHTTGSEGSITNYWNGTNSSVIGVLGGYAHSSSNQNYVAYCWAPVEGYSAFGTYTGNGSTDGPFVYTGFRSRFILQKSTGSESYGHWHIYDTARDPVNAVDEELYANLSNSVGSIPGGDLDILSNGFKMNTNFSGGWNTSGTEYVWAAFAENPFQANGGLAR